METETVELTAEEKALERQEWIADAVDVLIAEPFSWPADHAQRYADAIADTYLAEGLSAEEAIEEDRQYWD